MNLKIQALRAKYQAQKLEALATLEVYMKSAVGIGEHPQIIEEMDKQVRSLADAEDCLETLDRVFIERTDGNQGGVEPIND
jgi:hypothetical protein